MFTISFVNFLQVGLLTLSIFGILVLASFRQYRQICLLLALVSVASIFNLLEELDITRNLYLVTPIFVIGFGPAIYLAIKGILGDKLGWLQLWHFLPMLAALPFTRYPEAVIAIGTLWRIIYAALSLRRLFKFQKEVMQQRSDAFELSMNWLAWSLAIMTFVSMLNLVRLNVQPLISYSHNLIGQGISTGVSLLFFMLLIRQLIYQKDALASLFTTRSSEAKGESFTGEKPAHGLDTSSHDNDHYGQIFGFLSKEIQANDWYQIPRLTLNQLSELSGLQPREISRAINVTAKQNFNDYINHLRLEDVIRQMDNKPEQSFLNLAMAAGFNSKSSFNQVFKRHHGMTPMEFRQSRQG